MAITIETFEKSIVNTNPANKKLFNSLKENAEFNMLLGSSYIPNQAFATAFSGNKPTILYFQEDAYTTIQKIRELDHLVNSLRSSKNKSPIDIKYACYGYQDFEGNIVITKITCPTYEYAQKKFDNMLDMANFIATSKIPQATNQVITKSITNFVTQSRFETPAIGTAIVGLIGHTKQGTSLMPEGNCFTFSELTSSILPDKTKINSSNIITGTIAITPKTINVATLLKAKEMNENFYKFMTDGSLECAVISYRKNKNNTISPVNILNIICAVEEKNGKLSPVKISSSEQPLAGIEYIHGNINIQQQEDLTM